MSDSPNERRRYSRVEFEAKTSISQNDVSFDAKLIDISLNGALISTPSNYELKANTPVTIDIVLANDAHIQMQGHLVHSSSDLLGFQSDSIGMESIGHLRRLIELNLDDPNAPERVLDELLRLNY